MSRSYVSSVKAELVFLQLKEIDVLVFDLDNTLIATREADRKTVFQCAAWLEMHGLTHEESKNVSYQFNTKFRGNPCPENIGSMVELDAWRKSIWKSVLPDQFSNLVDEIYSIWKKERKRRLMLSSNVQNLMAKLMKRYTLAILTNGPSVAQWEKINDIEINRFCDTFVVSGDHRVQKPQKQIFNILCHKLKVHPNKCAMIGDRLDTDILGAQKAGFGATIYVQSGGGDIDYSNSVIPDISLRNVEELITLIYE